jgi:predicted O-linked N-acetylglucosamine transferase (SPINDLY family)
MEPPQGDEHYTERLVRLPNLSIYYEPAELDPIPLERQELGLRTGATVYWCGQSLYKFLPQFDDVFPRVAREVGDCQFVFIQYQRGGHVTELFKRRLDGAFAAYGLRAQDYCIFLPRLDPQRRFLAAVRQSDIVLDSIGWTGCNSTLETLPFDLPIVTLTGALMRGRHSTAILAMMGVTETIAATLDDYVSFSVRLALDALWRTAVRERMAKNKHRVYRDLPDRHGGPSQVGDRRRLPARSRLQPGERPAPARQRIPVIVGLDASAGRRGQPAQVALRI